MILHPIFIGFHLHPPLPYDITPFSLIYAPPPRRPSTMNAIPLTLMVPRTLIFTPQPLRLVPIMAHQTAVPSHPHILMAEVQVITATTAVRSTATLSTQVVPTTDRPLIHFAHAEQVLASG